MAIASVLDKVLNEADRITRTKRMVLGQYIERSVAVLTEETGEVARAALEVQRPGPKSVEEKWKELQEELIQVAAVATLWAAYLERE